MKNKLRFFLKGLTFLVFVTTFSSYAFVSILEDLQETKVYQEHLKKISKGFEAANLWRTSDKDAARRLRSSALGQYSYPDTNQADRDSEAIGSVKQSLQELSDAHRRFVAFIDRATRPGEAFFSDITIENVRNELYNLSTQEYSTVESRAGAYMASMTILSYIVNNLPETEEKINLAATALSSAALATSGGDSLEAKALLEEMKTIRNVPEKIRLRSLNTLTDVLTIRSHIANRTFSPTPEPPIPTHR